MHFTKIMVHHINRSLEFSVLLPPFLFVSLSVLVLFSVSSLSLLLYSFSPSYPLTFLYPLSVLINLSFFSSLYSNTPFPLPHLSYCLLSLCPHFSLALSVYSLLSRSDLLLSLSLLRFFRSLPFSSLSLSNSFPAIPCFHCIQHIFWTTYS